MLPDQFPANKPRPFHTYFYALHKSKAWYKLGQWVPNDMY